MVESLATDAFYQSLYEDSAVAWDENRRALHEIIELSESKRIPCIVLLLPILHELNDDYPFAGIHAIAAEELAAAIASLPAVQRRVAERRGGG